MNSQVDILKTILEEFRHVGEAISKISDRQAQTEGILSALEARTARIEAVDARLTALDTRVVILETQGRLTTTFDDKAVSLRRFLIGFGFTITIAALSVLLGFSLSHMHWR